MVLQLGLAVELRLARLAGERLPPLVPVQVRLQIPQLPVRLPADVAHVRLDPVVLRQVLAQLQQMLEALLADPTDVLHRPVPDVLVVQQLLQRRERRVARLALEHLLLLVAVAEVLAQLGDGREVLAAVLAVEVQKDVVFADVRFEAVAFDEMPLAELTNDLRRAVDEVRVGVGRLGRVQFRFERVRAARRR